MLWLPLQGLFIRLLSAAAERVLALVEHPPIVTALTANGNSIKIHSYVMGVSQPLTSLNCESLHISVVTSLALALSVPLKRWSVRAKVCGLTLAFVFLAMLAVCVVQLELAAETHTSTYLGITLHTVEEKVFLDWAIRKSSLVAIYVVPAVPFLIAYLSVWFGAGWTDSERIDRRRESGSGSRRSARLRWRAVSIAVAGCVAAWLLLVPPHSDQAGRVDLQGLRKIVALNPSSPRAHFNLALNLERKGGLDEALDSYQKALRLDPDLMQAQIGSGNVHFARAAYDQAARCYEEVLKRDPHNTAARYNLGNAFLKNKFFDQAAQAFEEVLRFDPDDASANLNLAKAYMHLHRRCDALTHLERALALDRQLSKDEALRAQIPNLRTICLKAGQDLEDKR